MMRHMKIRSVYLYCIYFLFVLFFSSCAALHGKKCDCPSWSMEQLNKEEQKILLNATEV